MKSGPNDQMQVGRLIEGWEGFGFDIKGKLVEVNGRRRSESVSAQKEFV